MRTALRTAPASALALTAALALLSGAAHAENRGVRINPGDRVFTAIDPGGDRDHFVFQALAGTVLSAAVLPTKGSGLMPGLEVLDPAGDPVDVTAFLTAKKNKVFLKKLVLPVSGLYLLRVRAADGSTGEYQLKTKGKPQKAYKFKRVPLAAGEVREFVFGGVTDAVLKAKVKTKGGQGFQVLALTDPQGGAVPGALARFVTKPTSAKATVVLAGGFGDYALSLENGPAVAEATVILKVKLPKTSHGRRDISPDEPEVLGVDPAQGSEGTIVTVIGLHFEHSSQVLFGDTPAKSTSFISTSELRATVPAGDGPVGVTVENPDGQANTKSSAFIILIPAPTVAQVDPVSGPSAGGTLVNVFGDRMTSVKSVTLGGGPVTGLAILSDGQLRFTTLPHGAGPADLRLVDKYDRVSTRQNAFTFLPTFEDVTAARMPANSGQRLAGGIAMALGDLDGDNDLDLLVANDVAPFYMYFYGYVDSYGYREYGLRQFQNDGSGGFRTERPRPTPTAIGDGGQGRAMALGDLDGDNDLDLVVMSRHPFYGGSVYYYYYGGQYYYYFSKLYSSARVLLNDGSGNLALSTTALPDPTAVDGTDILNGHALALGDVDEDGDLDLVVAHRWNAYTSYSYDFYSSSLGHNVYLTLFTAYDYSTAGTRILLNDGNAHFTDVTDAALPDIADGDIFAADAVLLGDVDRDGHLDILLSSDRAAYYYAYYAYLPGSKTRILKGDGTGSFTNVTSTRFPATKAVDEWGGRAMALGDLDGDGWPELVLSTGRFLEFVNPYSMEYQYFSSTRIFRGGSGGFTETTFSWMPPVVNYWKAETFKATGVAMGDVDGDLDVDLILSHYAGVFAYNGNTGKYDIPQRSIRWLRNQGTGVMEDVSAGELPDPSATNDVYIGDAMALGDLDGDADLDILITGNAFTQSYFVDTPYATRQLMKR